jgi:lipoprotein NlpD
MKNTIPPLILYGMRRRLRQLTTLSFALLLAGCGTMRSSVVVEPAPGGGYHLAATRIPVPVPVPAAHTPIPGGSYVVMKGDTLYSIAFRNGVDFRDLAQWNGIAEPYTIWPGQRLTLSPQPQPRRFSSRCRNPLAASRSTLRWALLRQCLPTRQRPHPQQRRTVPPRWCQWLACRHPFPRLCRLRLRPHQAFRARSVA